MSLSISERVVSTKRHTVGFVISRQTYTRAQAIKMAKQGQIKGVRVAHGPQGAYLVSTTDKSLYALPTRVQTPKACAAKSKKSR